MTLRSTLMMGAFAAIMAGCANSYVVVPASGGTAAAASKAGISLVAHPDSWDGDPANLPEYLTPVWVDIANQTSQNVRIRYKDFSLTDPSGFRYAAISPYSGQPQVPRRRYVFRPAPAKAAPPASAPQPTTPPTAPMPTPEQTAPAATPQAEAPSATPMSYETGPWFHSPHEGVNVVAMYYDRDGDAPGRGDFLGNYYGDEYSPYADYYYSQKHPGYHGDPERPTTHTPGPGFWQPWPQFAPMFGEGIWVYSWDYGRRGAPSADLIQLGLPEGELEPGGRVSGFIYFQHAVRQPGRLDLTWTVHAMDGKSIASVTVPMVVVREY